MTPPGGRRVTAERPRRDAPIRPSRVPSTGRKLLAALNRKEVQTMKWFLASLLIVFALVLPATASADDGKEEKGLMLRVTGDVTIAKDQTVGAVVVIDGTATIDGTVTDSLTVINGTAIINGTVREDVTVIAGTLDL